MSSFRSIRFKLSVQYSAVVFGMGGALLALVFFAIRRMLRQQTMTQYVITGEPVYVDGVLIGRVPTLQEHELRTLESLFNEHVLEELARFTVFSLVALFLLSLIVGWVMSGRFLKPIEQMTDVAREIEASDLSRRIEHSVPDDELGRLAATFNAMLERLDRAFSSQKRFLADTSHDLRTPLTVIKSNVEVVAADETASVEDWREVGAIVDRNTEKMSRMIEDLLAVARFETGRAQAVTLDLSTLVTEKVGEYSTSATAAGIELVAEPSTALVEGVRVSLDRAVTNLLDNALGVSNRGDAIRVGSGAVDGWAWLSVEDEGPGFGESSGESNVGLGLSIVEKIAEAHGGNLATGPGRNGHGTTMTVWIPTDEADAPHPDNPPFTKS